MQRVVIVTRVHIKARPTGLIPAHFSTPFPSVGCVQNCKQDARKRAGSGELDIQPAHSTCCCIFRCFSNVQLFLVLKCRTIRGISTKNELVVAFVLFVSLLMEKILLLRWTRSCNLKLWGHFHIHGTES